MPSIVYRPTPTPTSPTPSSATPTNPLPPLLQTPLGHALLELQGTINLPPFPPDTAPAASSSSSSSSPGGPGIPIGRLHFPDYDSAADGSRKEGAWMRKVWMFVGEHQRLQGEVKKLPRAVAVLRRKGGSKGEGGEDGEGEGDGEGELEVVEIVKYKLVFSSRPEPVGGGDL